MWMKLLKPHCYPLSLNTYLYLPVPSSYISGPKCKDAKQAQFKAVKLKENFWDLLRFCSLLTRWCTKVSKKQNWQCIANIWTDFYCFLHQACTYLWIYLVNEVNLNELTCTIGVAFGIQRQMHKTNAKLAFRPSWDSRWSSSSEASLSVDVTTGQRWEKLQKCRRVGNLLHKCWRMQPAGGGAMQCNALHVQ